MKLQVNVNVCIISLIEKNPLAFEKMFVLVGLVEYTY